MSRQLTWDAQIINSHARETRECSTILDPPFQCIRDVLDVSGKVGIKFIVRKLWLWLGQAREVVEHIAQHLPLEGCSCCVVGRGWHRIGVVRVLVDVHYELPCRCNPIRRPISGLEVLEFVLRV